MLKRWSLANFKSFGERTDLDLAPITVLAGANSSGKSTVIQSILLLKQTIQYMPAARAIGLNGPLLKLGFFDDIVNYGTQKEDVELAWEIDALNEYRPTLTTQASYGIWPSTYGVSVTESTANISFGIDQSTDSTEMAEASRELRRLQPILKRVIVTAGYGNISDPTSERKRAQLNLVNKASSGVSSQNVSQRSTEIEMPFLVERVDEDTRQQLSQKRPDGRLIGADTRHFFPSRIGISYNRRRDTSRRVAAALASSQDPYRSFYQSDVVNFSVPAKLAEAIANIFRSASEKVNIRDADAARIRRFVDRLMANSFSTIELVEAIQTATRQGDVRLRTYLRGALLEESDRFERMIYDASSNISDVGLDLSVPAIVGQAVELTTSFFTHSIRYLGPLRDDPKPVYPLEALVNPTDVGYRGEHTAAVLDLHRDRILTYISSRHADDLSASKAERATLHSAVVDWLSYLGVAQGVSTADLGKMGHQLQVRTGDVTKDHDLTNVGVGVSQLLPIIVMSLLAPLPSLLIFEQPELHLHPKVQARLGDFFLSMSLTGRQCLLETHSEYLIERLRRRIAESEGESVSSKIKIYFTEKKGGRTVCTPVQVTEFGAIKNWPSDFFDQTQNETEKILAAAQAKMTRIRNALKSGRTQ